jgi:hypothetical protein
MKKSEKYIAVNNQEDEDGYILYRGYAIYGGNFKGNRTVSDLHKAANIDSDSPKRSSASMGRSTSRKPDSTKK